MKKQQGFALFISLIILIILTFIGFSFASRGKLSSQVAQTSSRYETVVAAAEDEMYRLLNLLSNTEGYIKTGKGVKFSTSGDKVTQVWESKELAKTFGNKALPVFSNYSNAGWHGSHTIKQTFKSSGTGTKYDDFKGAEYGTIQTQGFIQELVKKVKPSTGEITVQYLITVKAFGQNPGDTTDMERESIAIQSLSEMKFGPSTTQ